MRRLQVALGGDLDSSASDFVVFASLISLLANLISSVKDCFNISKFCTLAVSVARA